VAVSYAHEDADTARRLTLHLQSRGYEVFFDGFKQDELGGVFLPPLLKQIYDEDSRFCVILVSMAYVKKKWTTYEFQVILAASDREWELLGDPDSAIAIPLAISTATIAVA
jgi:hypothetical protein